MSDVEWRREVVTKTDDELIELLRSPITHPDARQIIRDELLIRLMEVKK
jgi:hypothetical protein